MWATIIIQCFGRWRITEIPYSFLLGFSCPLQILLSNQKFIQGHTHPHISKERNLIVLKIQWWPFWYSFRLVWFHLAGTKFKFSSYKNDSLSEVSTIFSGGPITTSFQNTLSSQLYSSLWLVFTGSWGDWTVGWRLAVWGPWNSIRTLNVHR